MLALVFTLCLMSDPKSCTQAQLTFEDMTYMQCQSVAQPYLAKYISEHPKYTIKDYACKYLGEEKHA